MPLTKERPQTMRDGYFTCSIQRTLTHERLAQAQQPVEPKPIPITVSTGIHALTLLVLVRTIEVARNAGAKGDSTILQFSGHIVGIQSQKLPEIPQNEMTTGGHWNLTTQKGSCRVSRYLINLLTSTPIPTRRPPER